jgi:hypothetical protein
MVELLGGRHGERCCRERVRKVGVGDARIPVELRRDVGPWAFPELIPEPRRR